MDLITQATRLALNTRANYNPGLPITINFHPLTIDPKQRSFTPLTHPSIFGIGSKVRTNGSLSCHSINSQVKARILSGVRGCCSDYTGLLILAFYSQDPDKWHALFHRPDMQISYSQLLIHITGIPNRHAAGFIISSEPLFRGEETPDDPRTQEKILRSLLEF